MIVANKITQERKGRLKSYGIAFKEVPIKAFLEEMNSQTTKIQVIAEEKTSPNINKSDDVNKDNRILFNRGKSRFLPIIKKHIENNSVAINSGNLFYFDIDSPGGYIAKNLLIKIIDGNNDFFITQRKFTDQTRFPTRIRSLVTALRDCSIYGDFILTHKSGLFEITKKL